MAIYKLVTMTNWLPTLSSGHGSLYQRLADGIEADIDSGQLKVGAKLPPQRDLAYDMGTTVGTVGRAYQLLRERGLVSGEVGRGTYILDRDAVALPPSVVKTAWDGTRALDTPPGKIRFDSAVAADVGQGEVIAGAISRILLENRDEIVSSSRRFPDHWNEAGSHWLTRNGFAPDPSTIVPTAGTHTAIIASIAATTAPGDAVIFEHITFSQIARATEAIGRRVVLVRGDDDGILPDDFESVCAQKHPKCAFLMPAMHNPTCGILPAERRAEIARIARQYNVTLIEDDLYGSISGDDTPLLAEYAPERTLVVSGLSKSLSGNIRGGWVSAPQALRHRIRVAHHLLAGTSPFLLMELGAQLALSGQAQAIRARTSAEAAARLDIVKQALVGYDFASTPNVPYIWLQLPQAWTSASFKRALEDDDVLIDDEDEFKAGRSAIAPGRVRIGFTSPAQRETVETGIKLVRARLDEGPTSYGKFE